MAVRVDNCFVVVLHLPYVQECVGDVRYDNGLGGDGSGGRLQRVSSGV